MFFWPFRNCSEPERRLSETGGKARSTSKIKKEKEKIKLKRSCHGEEQVVKNSCKDGEADGARVKTYKRKKHLESTSEEYTFL